MLIMRNLGASSHARLGVCFMVLTVLAALMEGQGTTNTLGGFVTDPSGGAVPGAQVTATNIETKAVRTNLTNDAGLYSFPFLPIGVYEVSVKAKGFSVFVQT